MTQPAKPSARLTPARPADAEDSAGYRPRLPWRWMLLGTLSIATVTGGYLLTQRRKADQLRAQIVQVHERELAEPARRYLELRDKLEGWIVASAQQPPQSFVDKRLRIPGLRSGKGLYLRLPTSAAQTRKTLREAAKRMDADAIPACLGLAPASARGLWQKGEFLTPEWLQQARKDDGVMQLRVTDTVLMRHIQADLPAVVNMLRSDWFMLVLQQGENRRDAPVDAFLWDLRSGQQLLRTRVQASGVLMSARVRSKDAPAAPRLTAERVEDGAAHDCSIASQLKELAGMPAASVQNVQPAPAPAAPAAPAASAPAPSAATAPSPAAAPASPPAKP